MDELALERVATPAAAHPEVVTGVLALVNAAYDAAERTLWNVPLGRTNADEVGRWIAAGSLVTARASGRLVGSVTSHLIDAATGWFGALAVDPAWAGRGIERHPDTRLPV